MHKMLLSVGTNIFIKYFALFLFLDMTEVLSKNEYKVRIFTGP